ncbi:hypothetical protein BH10BAC2_BH10BAC2_11220 [soil metagenome]
MKTGLAACILLSTSCKKEVPINSDLATKSDAVSKSDVANNTADTNTAGRTATYSIGQRFGGGIIFWLNNTKTGGLIADISDLEPAMFKNGTAPVIPGTTASGKLNTQLIVAAQGPAAANSKDYAALVCVNSRRGGFADWFLPSKQELNKLYLKRNVVGGFAGNDYWSSSLFIDAYPWSQFFGTSFPGYQNYNIENYFYSVRAIRSF